MALPLIVSFLMGAASVAALIYAFAQRQMDEVGNSFAAAQPLCPYCNGALTVEERKEFKDSAANQYSITDRVSLKCDCGAKIMVYGWRKYYTEGDQA